MLPRRARAMPSRATSGSFRCRWVVAACRSRVAQARPLQEILEPSRPDNIFVASESKVAVGIAAARAAADADDDMDDRSEEGRRAAADAAVAVRVRAAVH